MIPGVVEPIEALTPPHNPSSTVWIWIWIYSIYIVYLASLLASLTSWIFKVCAGRVFDSTLSVFIICCSERSFRQAARCTVFETSHSTQGTKTPTHAREGRTEGKRKKGKKTQKAKLSHGVALNPINILATSSALQSKTKPPRENLKFELSVQHTNRQHAK